MCCQNFVLPLNLISAVFCSQRRKASLTHDVETSKPNGWAEAFFWGLFQMEKIGHLSLCTTKTVTHGEQSHWRSEGNSISFGTKQPEKERTRFRSLLGDLNQTKLEETIWCMFLWDNFLVLLSTHNSKHSQGNWMLQTGSKQIILSGTVSTQVQRQDPFWKPFLPLQRGHSVCSSARDPSASHKGEPPFWGVEVKMGSFSGISARGGQGKRFPPFYPL